MIRVTELRKRFGDNEILKGITFEMPPQVVLGVIGASGSGKSTLINETLYPILNTHFFNAVKKPQPYKKIEGEAAFYGPKLDVQVRTALGKDETLSTVQLDFHLPERFELKYIGDECGERRPE